MIYLTLPENCSSRIYPFHGEIKLANGHHIKIIGTADLKIRTDKMNIIKTYVLLKTSHPMILGMNLTRSPTRIFNGEILSFTFLNIFPLDFSTFAFTSFRTISSFFYVAALSKQVYLVEDL